MSCQRTWHIAEVEPDSYRFDRYNSIGPDSTILSLIAPYKKTLDSEMNQIIGQVETKLVKQKPESTLGNFVADLLVSQAEKCTNHSIDFAAQNYGGIRVPEVGVGPFSKSKAFDIMPFDNIVTVIEADGRTVNKLFNHIAQSGGWPVSESVKMIIQNEQLVSVTINEEPIVESNTYVFAIPDYIANGADDCEFLISQKRLPCNLTVRDAIIQHIEGLTAAGQSVSATLSNRIIAK